MSVSQSDTVLSCCNITVSCKILATFALNGISWANFVTNVVVNHLHCLQQSCHVVAARFSSLFVSLFVRQILFGCASCSMGDLAMHTGLIQSAS